jgi:hypothetical protein
MRRVKSYTDAINGHAVAGPLDDFGGQLALSDLAQCLPQPVVGIAPYARRAPCEWPGPLTAHPKAAAWPSGPAYSNP